MRLTPEHEAFRDSISRWLAADVNPHCEEWEAAGIFPARQVFRGYGAVGGTGAAFPEEYGGLGLDWSWAAVAAEALGDCASGGVAMALGVQSAMCTPALAEHGSDQLRRDWLAPAIAGDAVGCIGVSEPGGGSDVAALRTKAVKDGDDYVITGEKMWITNGTQADFCCLLANTAEGPAHRTKSLIVVPMDAPGVTVTRKIEKLGMRASDTAQLFFDGVRVPQSNRIGAENMGFIYQMQQFQLERLWGALNTAAMLKRAIEATVEYTGQRRAFGRPLSDNQYIAFQLADLATEVAALRALAWEAVEDVIAGQDATEKATMAKLKAGRLARLVPDQCLQFWGGMGYAEGSEINRIYRDARLTAIGGGADEVMMQVLTKFMGTFPKGN